MRINYSPTSNETGSQLLAMHPASRIHIVLPGPTDQRPVAAPVWARKTRFKPASRACITYPGAQWTARPTLTLRLRAFALKTRMQEAMHPYRRRWHGHTMHAGPMRAELKMLRTPRGGVRSAWPRNYYCAVARGALGRRSPATGTVARPWADLARGHLGRSALKLGGAWDGLFSTGTVLEP